MKRSLLVILALFLLAFVAITISRWGSRGPDQTDPSDSLDRQALVSFWTAHQKATHLRTQGDFAGAESFYREALELDPDHEECLFYLAACLYEQAEYVAARETFEELLDRNPLSQRGQGQLGSLLSTPLPGIQMEPEEAERLFLKIAEANPEESGTLVRLGRLFLRQGLLDKAYESFQTAAGFRSPEGLFLAGLVLYRREQFAEASARFEEVLSIAQREKEISGRGVMSEGDVDESGEGKPLTPLASSALKARVFQYWTSLRTGENHKDLLLNGRGSLPASGAPQIQRLPLAGVDPAGDGVFADFDGDGNLDLAIGQPSGAPRILLNREGRWSPSSITWEPAPRGSIGLTAADVDADGDADILVSEFGYWRKGQVLFYRNSGGWNSGVGRFAAAPQSALSQPRTSGRFRFAELNGDRRPDLVELASDTPSLRYFQQAESGEFEDRTSRSGLSFDGTAVDVAMADWNQDGHEDLFVVRWRRPGLLFENDGRGRFRDVTEQAGITSPSRSYSAAVLDWDRDGLPDLFVSRFADWESVLLALADGTLPPPDQLPVLFKNLGDGRFQEMAPHDVGLNQAFGTLAVKAVDVDGNGWTDLVLANGGFGGDRLEASVILLNQEGRFGPPLLLPPDGTPESSDSVVVADFDGDGRSEVFLSGLGLFKIGR